LFIYEKQRKQYKQLASFLAYCWL